MFTTVPVHGYVHAGVNTPIFSEEIIETLRIPKSSDKDLHGIVVYGDSMEPVISDRDYVIVSLTAKASDGDVCLVA